MVSRAGCGLTGASAGPGRLLRMSAFLAGYLLAWAVAGTVAFAALAGAGRLLTASPTAAKWLGVAIFTTAGIYQLTPWKDWCLRRCRSPIGALLYYLGFKGRSRDVRVGLHHGATCAGCCWGRYCGGHQPPDELRRRCHPAAAGGLRGHLQELRR